jgi:hypothetical protein
MARREKPGQLGFNFEADPEPPAPVPVEAPSITGRDFPPWHPIYVQWWQGLGLYGRIREQIRLDRIALREEDESLFRALYENRIRANQTWLDRENNIPF